MHADLGPHNEFVACAPYSSQHRTLEMLFRESGANGFGPEYEGAGELRDAFWAAISEWKTWNESEASEVFLE
ncbi:uncharacterized protein BROUX77_005011 [Berkeleyomyces rouxiae]|uniref:uncharacterized protein n=1 Tax=Berkeleyomyces rouxiae TaxID=2035830 RepID=UPI003B81DA46